MPQQATLIDSEHLWQSPIVGIDEVGYGAWAGPVAVCALILHKEQIPLHLLNMIQDSKLLSRQKRQEIYSALSPFVSHHVAFGSVEEINTLNILQATLQAAERALSALKANHFIQTILIDGKHKPQSLPQAHTIVSGDKKSISIAAASIFAKVTRDHFMESLSNSHPFYLWEKNAGYGTQAHRKAIQRYGLTPHHRIKFVRKVNSTQDSDMQSILKQTTQPH